MTHIQKFKKETELIEKLGEGNAHLIWSLCLYLDFSDYYQLATESLTDGMGDKKIDFLRLDIESKRLIIAQGKYSINGFYKAESNKASDLNTAIAWIFSGDLNKMRGNESGKFQNSLKEIAADIRQALEDNDIEEIEILYVHNMAESKNVEDEIETVKKNIEKVLNNPSISVFAQELGAERIERLFRLKEAAIVVDNKITLPEKIKFEEKNKDWNAAIFTVSGIWLKDLYDEYQAGLFSANYRGFLGINRRGRKKINSGIKATAENQSDNFWAFNNGITILTTKFYPSPTNADETILEGISIINGAQTTGSLAHSNPDKLKDVKVLCRVISSGDEKTINSIIEFNNTQNEIKTWDRFSKNPEQERIAEEFKALGYDYSFKRGFEGTSSGLSIEIVAQPVAALHGNFYEASSGKNNIFSNNSLYDDVFHGVKAKHLLLAHCLVRAIDARRWELKTKNDSGTCTDSESKQLVLLRYLKFKYFFLTIVGRCFENIVGDKVDLKSIAFANKVAGAKHNTIENLVDLCRPVINNILSILSNTVKREFNDVISDKDEIDKIVVTVNTIIESVKMSDDNNIYAKFSNNVAPQG